MPTAEQPSNGAYSEQQSISQASLVRQVAEVHEYLIHYLEARKDKAKLAARRLLVIAGIVSALAIAWMATTLYAIQMLLTGFSEGVGTMLGVRRWLGQLVVGGGVLGCLLIATCVGIVWWNYVSRLRMIEKYERRHKVQRSRFDSNADQHGSS
jgi:hypothetical protein